MAETPGYDVDLTQLARRLNTVKLTADRLRKTVDAFARGKPLLAGPAMAGSEALFSELRLAAAEVLELDPAMILSEMLRQFADARLSVEEAFLKSAASRGWDVSGNWPDYVLAHLVPFRFDMKRQQVTVGDRPFRSLDIEKPLGEAERAIGELRARQVPADDFIQALTRAYEAVLLQQRKPSGTAVSIQDVFRKLRLRQGKQYSVLLFGLDLSRVHGKEGGRQISLSPSRGPDRAVYVPSPTGGGGVFVSGIRM